MSYLTDLPLDVLLHIVSFLDARFVANTLTKVCQRFYELFTNNHIWRARMISQWSSKYLARNDEEIDWQNACVEREYQHHLWSNHETEMTVHKLPTVHIGTIDAFHMLKSRQLISASRDRTFCIWDLDKLDQEDALIHHSPNAHEGWIWSIDSNEDLFFTGAWDNTIKCWDKVQLNCLQTIQLKAPVLNITHKDNLIYAGTFSGIWSKDLRDPESPAQLSRCHKLPVLGLTIVRDNFLVSISEDQSLVVKDVRINKILKIIKFEDFPTSISSNGNRVWIGDKGGSVKLLEAPLFETTQNWLKVHDSNVTSIQSYTGCIITSSRDKTMCILQPSEEFRLISRIKTEDEISGFVSTENMLATSVQLGVVSVWTPTTTITA